MKQKLLLGVCLCAATVAQVSDDFRDAMHNSMKQMDREMMSIPTTGNVDRDFAAMMMPHHAGAIAMAKAELRYGKDPVMQRLAQEILVEQQSEIDAMQLWLKKSERRRDNQ